MAPSPVTCKKLLELTAPKLSPVVDDKAANDADIDTAMHRLGQLLQLSFTNFLQHPKTKPKHGTASMMPIDALAATVAHISPTLFDNTRGIAPTPPLSYSPPHT